MNKLAETLKNLVEDKLQELSTDLLSRYKKKAGMDASASDKVADAALKDGNVKAARTAIKHADKRFGGVIKATTKQFVNDAK